MLVSLERTMSLMEMTYPFRGVHSRCGCVLDLRGYGLVVPRPKPYPDVLLVSLQDKPD